MNINKFAMIGVFFVPYFRRQSDVTGWMNVQKHQGADSILTHPHFLQKMFVKGIYT